MKIRCVLLLFPVLLMAAHCPPPEPPPPGPGHQPPGTKPEPSRTSPKAPKGKTRVHPIPLPDPWKRKGEEHPALEISGAGTHGGHVYAVTEGAPCLLRWQLQNKGGNGEAQIGPARFAWFEIANLAEKKKEEKRGFEAVEVCSFDLEGDGRGEPVVVVVSEKDDHLYWAKLADAHWTDKDGVGPAHRSSGELRVMKIEGTSRHELDWRLFPLLGKAGRTFGWEGLAVGSSLYVAHECLKSKGGLVSLLVRYRIRIEDGVPGLAKHEDSHVLIQLERGWRVCGLHVEETADRKLLFALRTRYKSYELVAIDLTHADWRGEFAKESARWKLDDAAYLGAKKSRNLEGVALAKDTLFVVHDNRTGESGWNLFPNGRYSAPKKSSYVPSVLVAMGPNDWLAER